MLVGKGALLEYNTGSWRQPHQVLSLLPGYSQAGSRRRRCGSRLKRCAEQVDRNPRHATSWSGLNGSAH
ncbi:MAG: hypothetical protein AB3X44_16430 [Leptothrix sp. (in: b-proteobacteria)]